MDEKFLNDNKELIEKNNKQIHEIRNKYYEVYRKTNVQIINDNYKEILTLKEEIKDIRSKLNDISLSLEAKKTLRQEYIKKNTIINSIYSDIKDNMNNIKEYFIESEPIIKIDKFDIVEITKKKKKKAKKKLSLDDFKLGMVVEFETKGDKKRGVIVDIKPELKTKVVVEYDSIKRNIPISKITIIEQPVEQSKKEEEPKEEPKEEEPKEEEPKEEEPKEADEPKEEQKISEGSNVTWSDKGKILKGVVEKETANSYKICCKPGKKSGEKGSVYQVSKSKVTLDID